MPYFGRVADWERAYSAALVSMQGIEQTASLVCVPYRQACGIDGFVGRGGISIVYLSIAG